MCADCFLLYCIPHMCGIVTPFCVPVWGGSLQTPNGWQIFRSFLRSLEIRMLIVFRSSGETSWTKSLSKNCQLGNDDSTISVIDDLAVHGDLLSTVSCLVLFSGQQRSLKVVRLFEMMLLRTNYGKLSPGSCMCQSSAFCEPEKFDNASPG